MEIARAVRVCAILTLALLPTSGSSSEAQSTLCQVTSREHLVLPLDGALQVVRIRLALPDSWTGPPACCGGEGMGVLHVNVKTESSQEKPYSAHLDEAKRSITLIVKVYPHQGVSGHLTSVPPGGFVNVPEIRAWDYHYNSRRVAMVCFGVGITECMGISEVLLARGAEVRMVYASKEPAQVLLLPELRDLLDAYPTRFRLRHCLSWPGSTHLGASIRWGGMPERQPPPGERSTHGRVNADVLLEEFDGPWGDGAPVEHFLLVGSKAMETAALNMVFEAGLRDPSQIRGHPDFLLMKGPRGQNTRWLPLAGAAADQPARPTQLSSDEL